MCVSGEFHATAAIHPGREPSYPLNSRLCVPHSRRGRFGEDSNLFLSLRMELRFLGLPVRILSLCRSSSQDCEYVVGICAELSCCPDRDLYDFSRVFPVEYLESRHAAPSKNHQISGIFMFTVKHDKMTMRQSQEFVSGRYKTFAPPLFFL